MLKTMFYSTNFKTSLKAAENFSFLIFKAKLVFLQLKQAFKKVFSPYYFDLKRYIWIKTYVFS